MDRRCHARRRAIVTAGTVAEDKTTARGCRLRGRRGRRGGGGRKVEGDGLVGGGGAAGIVVGGGELGRRCGRS